MSVGTLAKLAYARTDCECEGGHSIPHIVAFCQKSSENVTENSDDFPMFNMFVHAISSNLLTAALKELLVEWFERKTNLKRPDEKVILAGHNGHSAD